MALVRWAMACAVALVLLSGCLGQVSPTSPAPASLQAVAFTVPLDGKVPLNYGTECLSTCFASTDDNDMPRLPLAGNETVVALHAELDALDPVPFGAGVVFRVECEAAVGPGCPPLGEARGELPLRIDADAVQVPAGATLRFSGYLEGGAHVAVVSAQVEGGRGFVTGSPTWARLSGSAAVVRSPAPAPPLVPAPVARTLDGDLFCTPTSLTPPPYTFCGGYMRTWFAVGGYGWPLTAVNATLEWTANRDSTRELVLRIDCRQGDSASDQPCAGLPTAEARGPSPLALRLSGRAPEDAVFVIDVFSPVAPRGDQAPQPYRLTLDAMTLQDPTALD